MFPDPDQCQQDAGMLEDGKHARDQSLDLFSWSTPCTTLPPTPTSPHRGTVPRALQTHTTPHKHISTHTTHPDTKTPTTHASPSHITRHIPTHATVATHTYVPCVHGYTNTQRHTQTHMVTPNLHADNHSSHIHSGRGRAAGTEKKPQVIVYNLNLLLCCFSTMGTI